MPRSGNVVKLAVGNGHSCALLANGGVKCWGQNDHHQVTSANGNVTSPLAVSVMTQTNLEMMHDIIDVSAGSYHTCALRSDGTTLCWGEGAQGQLGVAGAIYPANSGSLEGVDAVHISANGSHTCAVAANGTAWCVGSNTMGQLGIGSHDGTPHHYPSQVTKSNGTALTGVISLSAGYDHNCALVQGGQVYCWGASDQGQTGGAASITLKTRATLVAGITDAISVVAGQEYTCVQRVSGSVTCFGRNDSAQLGSGVNTPSVASGVTPALPSDHGALQLDAGWYHTCQRGNDGTVQCEGINGYGQLGDGSFNDHAAPAPVRNLTSAVAVVTGAVHSCALLSNHTVQCWGYDWWGALGDGNTSGSRTAPWPVTGLNDALSIDAGLAHTCVITIGGLIKCWGHDDQGQLGDGIGQVSGIATVSGISDAYAVAAGSNHTCALSAAGLSCWGQNDYGQVGVTPNGNEYSPRAVTQLLGGEVALAGGLYHTCALTDGGQVECWGRGDGGQLGDGGFHSSSTHPLTATLEGASAIAAGDEHSCAMTSDGSLYCWGKNDCGQLGLPGTSARPLPTLVPVGAKIVALAATGWRTCVLTDSGSTLCYGQ